MKTENLRRPAILLLLCLIIGWKVACVNVGSDYPTPSSIPNPDSTGHLGVSESTHENPTATSPRPILIEVTVTPSMPQEMPSATAPVGTAVETQTATSTATVEAPLAATSPSQFEGPLVAFVQFEALPPNSLLLVDIGTLSARRLQFDNGRPVSVDWSENGCLLYVTIRTALGIEVVITDFEGSEQASAYQYFRNDPSRAPMTFHDEWALSPSGEYVAYIVFSGEHFYSTSEFQDVEIVTVNDQYAPLRLTSNGGALSFAWSSDSTRIAYSDYDSDGVRQLYKSNPDGSNKTQLTFFTEKGALVGEPMGNYIGRPVWSPDGNSIVMEAGITNEDGTFASSLWLVSSSGERQLQLLNGTTLRKSIMGWSEDSMTLAVYSHSNSSNEPEDAVLYWIDATSGDLIREMQSGQVPGSEVRLLAAVQGVEVWVGKNKDDDLVYLYHVETGILEAVKQDLWPQSEGLIDLSGVSGGEAVNEGQVIDAAISPPQFQGESTCR